MLSDLLIPFTSHAPKADGYDSNPVGQYVNSKHGDFISWFLQQKTAGSNTGTATITVLAASDNSGTGATAVAFSYRKKTTAPAVTAFGAVTAATASGFTTVANEDTEYEIEVNSRALPESLPYVALKLTEVVNDPVSVAVNGFITSPHYVGAGLPAATA